MPARTTLKSTSKLPTFKARRIRKPIKQVSISPTTSETLLDTEDIECHIQIVDPQPSASKKDIIPLLRELQHKLRFGTDTLLASLVLLQRIEKPLKDRRLTAATLFIISAKVHENRTPKMSDLSLWTGFGYGICDLEESEGQMLNHLGFKVPAVLGCQTLREVQNAISIVEN